MYPINQRFEWDEKKAWRNLLKHGVSFRKASGVFDDPQAIALDDMTYSTRDEVREQRMGRSAAGIVVVSFTRRGLRIRIINARKATQDERQFYEENKN
jgi:uncharacterized protein